MKLSKTILFLLFFTVIHIVNAQQYTKEEIKEHPCFIGTSAFVLYNVIPDDNTPEFAQLNFGYRINPKHSGSLELIHWRYAWSLDIPYGDSFEAPEEKFLGFIREKGIALAYQYFWWKGFYIAIHVKKSFQKFYNEQNQQIDKGFQLFNTYRLGYHFRLLKSKRFFIEPSLAITHRAYQTEMPNGFKQKEDKWSKFLFGEPGLHLGFNF